MKRKFRSSSLILALFVLVVTSAAHAHGPTSSDPSVAVRAVLNRNAAAFATGDLHTLDEIWSHDASVTVFESGYANYGWEDYRDHHLKPEMAELKNVKYVLSEIKPKIAGNTAWATFTYTISADTKERHVEGGGLGTAVLERRRDGWKIVHWHTSSPPKAETK